jgi:hypothetical protein
MKRAFANERQLFGNLGANPAMTRLQICWTVAGAETSWVPIVLLHPKRAAQAWETGIKETTRETTYEKK